MQIDYTARGGRMTKWKGMAASCAPGLVAVVIAVGAVQTAAAQETSYSLGTTTAPTVDSAAQLDVVNLNSTSSSLQAVVTGGAISRTETEAASASTTSNTISASVLQNYSAAQFDTGLNTATGTTSNSLITSAMTSSTADVFAGVLANSNITSSADLSTGGASNLSDNTLSASVTLSSATLTLQGDVAVGYTNTDAGSVNLDTDAGSTAGLLIQSVQTADDMQNATANGTDTSSFAMISGSDIDLTISGTTSNSENSVALEGNTLSAAFVGNTATNGINVEADKMPTLTGTAGISSAQTANQIGIEGALATETLTSATITSTAGMGIEVTGDTSGTAIDLIDNSLTATATLNNASNRLILDPGVSLAGQSNILSVETDLAAGDVEVDAADLFISNVQKTTDSNVSSQVAGADGLTVSAIGGLSTSSIDTTGNLLGATTDVNTASNVLGVQDAATLTGVVSNTNVQSFTDTTAYAVGTNKVLTQATAEMLNATVTLDVATATGENIATSSASLSENTISADAAANTNRQITELYGNVITSEAIVATTTTTAAPTTTLGSATLELQSALSSGNVQITTADSASTSPIVLAEVDGDESTIGLTAGGATGTLTGSALDVSGNDAIANAAANTSSQSLSVAATQLTASVALGNVQQVTGGVQSWNLDTGISLAATAGDSAGTATTVVASGTTLAADNNLISSSASGNEAVNVASVDATAMTVIGSAVSTSVNDTRTVLSSDVGGSEAALSGTAAISLLNRQTSAPVSTATIWSELASATVSNSLTTSGEAASQVALSSDGNDLTSMASANMATNVLSVDVGTMDLSEAFITDPASGDSTGSVGGTNIALLGSAQANTSAVTAVIDDTVDKVSAISTLLAAGTGNVANSSVSASDNTISILASGNSVANQLDLTATNLLTPDATTDVPMLSLDNDVSTDQDGIFAKTAAIVVGNEQSNTGAITATISATADTGSTAATDLSIAAKITGSGAISGTTVGADDNVILAQAVAASGSTNTATIGATNIATSALVGSVQTNAETGDLTATIGDAEDSLQVLASLGAAASGSSLSASGNLIGVTSTALTDDTTLQLGGDGTTMIAGTSIGSSPWVETTSAGVTLLVADYALGQVQNNAGDSTASVLNASVDAVVAAFTGGSIAVDGNDLIAQSTGIVGETLLRADAATLGSSTSGQSNPVMAIASSQINSGVITGTLSNAAVTISVSGGLGDSANSESLSLASNRLAATASGVTGSNQLITIADSAADGVIAEGSFNSNANVLDADRMLLSDQVNSDLVLAQVTDTPQLSVAVTGAASGAAIDLSDNAITGTATGASGSNLIYNEAGSSNAATSALAANQIGDGQVQANMAMPEILLSASGAVAGSALAIEGNNVVATATGLTTTNRVIMMADAALTGTGGLLSSDTDLIYVEGTSTLVNRQTQSQMVRAGIASGAAATTGLSIDVDGATSGGSSLSVASNELRAQATGVSATNLSAMSAGSITGGMASVTNDQSVSAIVGAVIDGPAFDVTATTVEGSVDLSGNSAIASATSSTATNVLQVTSQSLIDGESAGYATLGTDANGDMTTSGQPVAALLNRQATSGGTVYAVIYGMDTVLATLTDVTGSIAVDSNLLVAQSRGNVASNSLSVSAGSSISSDTQGLLASNQNRSGDISASVEGDMGIEIGAEISSLSGALSVDNNVVRASGAANVVVNTMTVTAGTISGASGAAATSAATPSIGSTAQFMVLNGQESASDVEATLSDYDIGLSSTGAITGATSLNGNMLMADATGNSSINTLRLAAAGTGAITPIAVVNSQTNTGTLSALVSGSSFTASGGGATSGDSSLSGNTISASTTGNLSSTTVGSPTSVFTSF